MRMHIVWAALLLTLPIHGFSDEGPGAPDAAVVPPPAAAAPPAVPVVVPIALNEGLIQYTHDSSEFRDSVRKNNYASAHIGPILVKRTFDTPKLVTFRLIYPRFTRGDCEQRNQKGECTHWKVIYDGRRYFEDFSLDFTQARALFKGEEETFYIDFNGTNDANPSADADDWSWYPKWRLTGFAGKADCEYEIKNQTYTKDVWVKTRFWSGKDVYKKETYANPMGLSFIAGKEKAPPPVEIKVNP
ncbi:MAG: hypothetical protein AB7P04_00175 [Bacteriovoracia bacterium]